ncbi:MAG: DEAD/DEAH box helicase [Acholeplasmatales bacterium]|nr:DEAD/DEAH box helicase [Acholeplasmatales bacterium]
MAKEYSKSDAKLIIEKHKKNLDLLLQCIKLPNVYNKNIKNSALNFTLDEVMNILRGVPVEEINSTKRGIRTKTLRDNGFLTMADIYMVKKERLVRIKGISDETAGIIKDTATEFYNTTKENFKLKLSIDKKTEWSSSLVRWVAGLIKSEELISEANDLYNDNNKRINELIDNLEVSLNSIKWMFSNKDKKNSADKAYFELKSMLDGFYGNRVNEIVKEINSYYKISVEDAWNLFSKESVKFYNILENINPGLLGNSDSLYGLPEELAKDVEEVKYDLTGLNCSLRKYQEWGVKYILKQERVLLGDEMGLGKTVQAIATMVSLRNGGAKRFLVVAPASVLTNWCREIVKHSDLRVTKIHGSSRDKSFNEWLKYGGVGVTTFETTQFLTLPEDFVFGMLIVDEAHYIKNPDAKRSRNVRELCKKSRRVLFMTGTAIENNVEEMINLIKLLQPAVAKDVKNYAYLSSAPQFRENVASVYYRRKRADVLTELPDLIETEEWCELGKEEEKIYEESVLSKKYHLARRMSWNIDDLEKSSKANRLKELVMEAEGEERKIIVFSFFLDTINKIKEFLGERCSEPINGSVPVEKRQTIIDEFNNAKAGSVLLAQIQSGGTGLNIQSASVVIFCEPQFKPSIENQAVARAYRMGQSRNVLVYRLLCENTIDEKLIDVLKEKQKIFDEFADKSIAAESDNIEVDDKTFGEIMEEEIERIKNKKETELEVDSENQE